MEERRRLKIIPNAFGERAVLKLIFGALIRAAERWKSTKVTEFERRQLTAVKKELDHDTRPKSIPRCATSIPPRMTEATRATSRLVPGSQPSTRIAC